MPQPSDRSRHAYHSPIRNLVRYAREAETKGKRVYYLNIGQPDIATPEMAMQRFTEGLPDVLAYGPSEGIPALRKAFTTYYRDRGLDIAYEDLMIMSGASEAILFALEACLDPGDDLLVAEPMYALYRGYARMTGVNIIPITCAINNGFALPSIADFEAHITSGTKAILLCNPNNPTGTVYPQHVLEDLTHVVRAHDIFLIVDEVYSTFVYDQPFYSALNLKAIAEHVIVIDSVSKRYSACGARIGTMISKNRDLIRQVTKFAEYRLSPPVLSQHLVERLLEMPESFYREMQAIFQRRRDYVVSRLKMMPGVTAYLPGGAFYVFAALPVDHAVKFCKWLLTDFSWHDETVMLAPGEGFYASPDQGLKQIRIAYVLSQSKLERAMDCLAHALQVYPAVEYVNESIRPAS